MTFETEAGFWRVVLIEQAREDSALNNSSRTILADKEIVN
jgi:hypothetical protein